MPKQTISFAFRISAYNRKRKWRHFLKLIKPTPDMKLLDVGFTEKEYSDSMNFIEKHYPFPEKITALGINTPVEFVKRYPKVKAIKYKGDFFPFGDKEFDICWSNAVIEHVGNREKQLLFLREINRTSKWAFLTTPNRYFPIETHSRTPLLHLLPKKIYHGYLRFVKKTWWTNVENLNLLTFHDIISLLKDAGISNYTIIRNRLAFFTLDFIIIFGEI